jgi:hypothetical protein
LFILVGINSPLKVSYSKVVSIHDEKMMLKY